MVKFSKDNREGLLQRLKTEEFDLIVVGGGITGAAILRDAVYRGLKVALIEMGDFASGTSSRSSKLIHGGLRYLKNLDFGLVFESVNERIRLMRLARHVVRPLSFVFPVFNGDPDGLFKLKMGMWLYDFLCMFRNYQNHTALSVQTITQWVPGLREQGLRGGVRYYDAITDDARITLEVIIDAYHHNGVPLNYVKAGKIGMENGKVTSLHVTDMLNGEEILVKTRFVAIAAGPWTPLVTDVTGVIPELALRMKLRPTKGSHLVLDYKSLPIDHAVVMLHPQDHRVMFALPWHNKTVLGTTDTDYKGNPSDVFATKEDVDYLLAAANHYFPEANLGYDDVVATWSGLRPLVDQGDAQNESDISREHSIVVDPSGIGMIAGGKLTTFRVMGKQMVDALAPFIPGKNVPSSHIKKQPLPYANGTPNNVELKATAERYAKDYGISLDSALHLLNFYGGNVDQVLGLAKGDKLLLQPVIPGLPVLMVEAIYAVRYEIALKLEDFFLRRTPLFFLTRDGLDLAFERVAVVMGQELDWDDDTVAMEIKNMETLFERHNQWRKDTD